MGFIWTIDPTPHEPIASADIQEIRDNTDWIKDNLACVSHNTGDDTNNNTTKNSTVETGHDSAHNAGDDASLHSGVRATHYGTYKVSYDSTHLKVDIP